MLKNILKNKKGFTLAELLAVILIIGTLASISVPMYLRSVRKARVAVNMPLIRSLQNDVVNFYNLNNTLPDSLWQLSLDRKEFDVLSQTKGIHLATNCIIQMNKQTGTVTIIEDCDEGWKLMYYVQSSPLGYSATQRIFKITGDQNRNISIAKSFGWDKKGNSTTDYVVK